MSEYPGYTSPNAPQHDPGSPPPPQEGDIQSPPPPPEKQRNTVGMIALITALVGFLFACIPGAIIVGWILLPIAFVLSIVGLALSGKPKGTSIAAIIVSIVGFIVGILVFFFVVGSAIDDAFSGPESEIIAPSDEDDDGGATEDFDDDAAEPDSGESDAGESDAGESDTEEGEVAEGEEGSRTNPIEIGSTIRAGEWDITVISFEPDATEEVLAVNEFNDEPEDGNTYGLVEAEVTYTGDDSGIPWLDISFAYVSESGNTSRTFDSMVVGPSPDFDDIGELYEGASGSGYVVLEISDGGAGLLRVSPGMFADDVFVATK